MALAKDFGFLGRLCLDFAQTGDMGYGSRYERLKNPSELQRWLSLSPLRVSNVKVNGKTLIRARRLRSAIWRVAQAALSRTVPAAADIRLINIAARRPRLVRQLDSRATSMAWRRPTMAAALANIAQDAVELFGDPIQRARLRRCENPGCKIVFYDDSRPGSRRWCAPNRCGDRIRARLYRARQKS